MNVPLNRIKLLYAIIEDNLHKANAEHLDWEYKAYNNCFEFRCETMTVLVDFSRNLIKLTCNCYKNHITDDLKLFCEDKNLTI